MISSIGLLVSRLVGVKLMEVVHPRTVTIYGSWLFVVALLLTARLEPGWPLPAFYAVLAFQAVTMSLGMMVISTVAYVDIPAARTAQAAGFFTTIQQLTMSFGVTLGVCTISAMRHYYVTTEHDGRIYSASLVLLSVVAALGAATTRNLDAHSLGQLRRQRQQA